MVAAMGKFKRNIVFLIHILRGSGLFEFKWYNATNCSALELPCRLHFFFSEQNYSGKNYVLRESTKSP